MDDDDDDDDDCSVCISCCTCSSASTTDVSWKGSIMTGNFDIVITDKKTKQVRKNKGCSFHNGKPIHCDLTNSPPPSPSSSVEFVGVTPSSTQSIRYDECNGIDTNQDLNTCEFIQSLRDRKKIQSTMARSKKTDSDTDSDSVYSDLDDDKALPPTTEDAFNNIFRGGTTLPTRVRKPPQRHGASPTPPLPLKKNVPLANSALTNQSTRKRSRRSAKSVTAAKLALARAVHASSSANDLLAVRARSRHVSLLSPIYYTPADSNLNGSSVAPLSSMPSGAPILQNDELLSLSGPNASTSVHHPAPTPVQQSYHPAPVQQSYHPAPVQQSYHPTPQHTYPVQQQQHQHFNPSNAPQPVVYTHAAPAPVYYTTPAPQQQQVVYHQPPQQQQVVYQQPPQQQQQQVMYQPPPQQQPVYQQSTQHVARLSYTPNEGRVMDYSVSHQVTAQQPQQFAAPPPSGAYPQQQLQYGQNPHSGPPTYPSSS